MRLPSVLSERNLPAPELYAARLDGDLFAIDGCFSPVDEIEQPRHRAAAAHAGLAPRLIAEQLSAAWVWGALDSPPTHHQFCVATGARVSHSPALWMTVREVVITTHEIDVLNGNAVTSRLRTAIDLARFATTEPEVLLRLSVDLTTAIDLIDARRNLPNKRQAIALLERAISRS
ncbi:MAG: hypothetical protein KF761_09800 [Salinibacterium sp.]|nr:hypothetical protein [Salinibacterium sp.]